MSRCLLLLVAVIIGMAFPGDAMAGPPPSVEYRVKAAFVYNFARFTQWPAASFQEEKSPVNVCTLGGKPFHGALDSIEGKKVEEHPLRIRTVADAAQADGCHILLFPQGQRDRTLESIRQLRGRPVMTVSDMHDFTRNGGIIGLVRENTKIRFHINLGAAREAGLTISSQLLKLARKVTR